MSAVEPWWAGVNAEIYFNADRFHAVCHELGVPIVRERTTATATAAEGGVEGGLFGLAKANSKLGQTRTTTSSEVVTEAMLILEAYERAASERPPRIIRPTEPEDWDCLNGRILVHGEARMRLVSERPPEFDTPNLVHLIEGEVAGRAISIRFSSNHLRSNSGTTHLFDEGSERVMFLGRLSSPPQDAETIEIRPVLLGYPWGDGSGW